MRISKDHDVRKAELLGAAEALFFEKGYEQTTVNAIIEKVGVSKGTFYYYFKSKEEIVDCLAERAGDQSMHQIQAVVDHEDLDALGKLNRVYETAREWQIANVELVMTILGVMYRDENLLLKHRIQQRSLEMSVQIFSTIIAQGLREGTFDISAKAEEVGELILRMGNDLSDSTTVLYLRLDENPEKLGIIVDKIALYQEALERILGAAKGSIRVLDRHFLNDFTEKYYKSQGKEWSQPVTG